jgi:tetratricopeptide (TPR) repeat protein
LGVLLSEQGRDEESIAAYQKSIALNSEDAELCYNLGVKLGERGMAKEEMRMYALATKANPRFGGAWLNWGTALAERGDLDDVSMLCLQQVSCETFVHLLTIHCEYAIQAELMFLKALECESDVASKAMINLGLLYNTRGNYLAQMGDMKGASKAAHAAAKYLDEGKALLSALSTDGKLDSQLERYFQQYRPLRLQTHRLIGQLYAGEGDMLSCEAEFRRATESFPEESFAWQMLSKVLEVQGKHAEASKAADTARSLMG